MPEFWIFYLVFSVVGFWISYLIIRIAVKHGILMAHDEIEADKAKEVAKIKDSQNEQ